MSDNHANFTPTLSGYSGQQPFRFWCQKVLPLVYDDSLSYYELLNKIVVYLNSTISDVATAEGNIESMLAAYENLQYYVNHWFDTVDLTNECYDALNRMAENGELDALIEPFVAERIDDVVAEQIGGAVSGQIDDVVAEQIGPVVETKVTEPTVTAVETWLNENVDPVGSAVVVDKSLSVSGAAADAEITGESVEDSTGNKRYIPTNGYYISLSGATTDFSPTESGGSEYIVLPCVEGDEFNVTGRSGNNGRCYGFVDGNGNVLVAAAANTTYENLLIVAPADSAYLVANSYNSSLVLYKNNLLKNKVEKNTNELSLIGSKKIIETNRWTIGGLNSDMNATASSGKRARIYADSMPVIPNYKCIWVCCSELFLFRVAIYNTRSLNNKDTTYTQTPYVNGNIYIPESYHNKFLDFDVKKADGSDMTSDDIEALKTNVYIRCENAVGDSDRIIAYCPKNLVEGINHNTEFIDNVKYFDVTNIAQYRFNKNKYINASGESVPNSQYPYLFGSGTFYKTDKHTPIKITMGSNEYNFRAYFYSDNTASSFVGRENPAHSGEEIVEYNGIHRGSKYNFIRLNIWKADQSHDDEDFNGAVENFKTYSTNKYGNRLPSFPYNRFKVNVNLNWPNVHENSTSNAETENNTDIECILKLPVTYANDEQKKPVPLIMFCHGASAQITDSFWYADNSNFTSLITAFTDAGFAVFDVNNTRDREGGYPDWGGLPIMEAYIKAWEYIKANYHVEKKLYIFSDSMGTCANLNMMKWYHGDIIASIQTAPRPICKYRYESLEDGEYKTLFAESFGLSNGEWDDNKLKGFCHYENIIEINGTKYAPEKFPPLKVMVGTGDTSFLEQTRDYYSALINSGNFVDYREVSGASHATMSFLSTGNLKAEAVAWFNRFREQ